MPSSTENVKLGVCDVIFDGINLGLTKGGVEVEVTTDTYEVTVDQYGATPISELVMGRKVSAKVPLAETTLENMLAIMPGSTLFSDGVKGTGTITLSTGAPVNNDKVTIDGIDFTFKTTPVNPTDISLTGITTFALAAAALAAAINAYPHLYVATAVGGVVTVTTKQRGAYGNGKLSRTWATPANCVVVNITGGTDATKAKVEVSSGVNINLLSIAKTLILRPRGTTGADDFTIHKAACPGALNFSYNYDSERIYQADFKGFVESSGRLFTVGDVSAV